MAKTKRFELRLEPSERATLERAARKAGMTPSSYIRALISGKRVQIVQLDVDGKRLDEAMHELKKSGTNLNQIARYLNRGRATLSQDELDDAMRAHRDAAERLASLIDETRPAC